MAKPGPGRLLAAILLSQTGRRRSNLVLRDWAIKTKLADHVEVSHDAPLLLAAGTPEGWAWPSSPGTGSVAFARAGRIDEPFVRGGSGFFTRRRRERLRGTVLPGLKPYAQAVDGRGPETVLTKHPSNVSD